MNDTPSFATGRGPRRLAGSLRARLIAAATGSILIAVALLGTAAIVMVSRQLHDSLDGALRHQAQEVAVLSVSAPALLTAPGALESPLSGRQIVVEVLDAHGRILARSQALGARLLPNDRLTRAAIRAGRTQFEDIRLDGRPFRLYAAPIADAGGPAAGGAVLVASDESDIADTTSHLIVLLILSALGAAALAAVAAAGLTRRGLRPLRGLADAAEEIERTGDPSRRLPESRARDEIGGLTGVLNRMLGGLERSRASERRFLADASHELRTPVTTLRGNVEYAAKYGADPEIIAELQRDATRLARLVDDLLVLERAGEASPRGELVELDALAREAAAASDRVELGPVTPVAIRGDEHALSRAISNLIENGLVHGPDGGSVTVSVQASGGRAQVCVSDEGSGPDPADREHLFERFWRGGRAAEQPGSGLGLSIVAAIVERHGGQVTVAGSTFTIDIPDAIRVATPQLRAS
ncbi:MAG TPA: HAMP domain-containing sensor histidine kinase [Solirubrobacteraceae bacterium]